MSTMSSRLPELIALANEGSSDKRRTLLRELTDTFFGSDHRSDAEMALYDHVLVKLTSEMEVAVRAEMSKRFSLLKTAPQGLVRALANDDEAVVAEAVLRSSPLLSDEDLLGVVKTRGQLHLRAVSSREAVSEAISEVIVARGDDTTLGTLLRNEGAQLSRTASETAIERAKVNPALHAAAVQRKNLPPDLLNEMYFVVEARLRQQILERNAAMDPKLVEAAVAAGRTRVETEDGSLPADYAACLAEVSRLQAAGQLTPPVLARYVRTEGQTAFLIALSRLADVDFHTAEQIVRRKELDALAVVCRGASVDRALFLTFAVVLLNEDGDAMAKAKGYADLYNQLTPDAAQRTLRFWRMRRTAQAA